MTAAAAGVTQSDPIDPDPEDSPTPTTSPTEETLINRQRTLCVLAITAVFMLGGCSSLSRQEASTVTGTAIGAMAGAAVGGPAATVGGAVIGGVVGHQVGKK